MLGEHENQFFLTRAVLSMCERVKNDFLSLSVIEDAMLDGKTAAVQLQNHES